MRIESQSKTDWVTILLFVGLCIGGWLNIYAAEYDPEVSKSIFDFSSSAGRQIVWIIATLFIGYAIFLIDFKLFDTFSFFVYLGCMLLLVIVLLVGKEISGSRSWFGIGSFGIQPAEFAKFATVLMLAKYLDHPQRKLESLNTIAVCLAIIFVPIALIILQGDTGSALVYTALVIPLFREGLSPLPILIGLGIATIFVLTLLLNQTVILVIIGVTTILIIGLNARAPKRILMVVVASFIIVLSVRSVDFVLNNVLQPHQQKRILSMVNPNIDRLGVGWNVTQSKIAIGSGGVLGKGYLEGTQTKFDFVPEQTTDFIFCTVGEEHGWIGAALVITAFVVLLLRIISIAERQKSNFARVYGYGVFAILFFHFSINIAMTIGLFPVVGIPLPFFSYGGSSLWGFTVLLFVLLKLDSHRMDVLQRW